MEPLISVIIPIYNVEKYLDQCIASVVAQTYKNLEILLIDDGSKDASGEICQKWAAADSRIIAIHKENGGVGSARNLGLSKIRGEYYCFIDGDDTVFPNYIEHLYALIKEHDADISMCAYLYKWEDGRTLRTKNGHLPDSHVSTDTGAEALKSMLYGEMYVPSCCQKLYNRDKVGIIHFENYAIGEDVLVSISYYSKAAKVVYSNTPLYYYIQHDASVMHSFSRKKCYDNVLTCDEVMKRLATADSETKKGAAYYLTEKNLITLMQFYNNKIKGEDMSHIKDNIRAYRKTIITDPRANKRTKIACLLSYGGFGLLCRIRNIISR